MEHPDAVSLIAAMTPARIIGHKGFLPWPTIPSDFKRFRALTESAGVVIMGSETFRSILARNRDPLSNRVNLVLTRKNTEFVASRGGVPVASVEAALERAGRRAAVIGGAQVFRACMPFARVGFFTFVHADLPGDAVFPALSGTWMWAPVPHPQPALIDSRDPYPTSFVTYVRTT